MLPTQCPSSATKGSMRVGPICVGKVAQLEMQVLDVIPRSSGRIESVDVDSLRPTRLGVYDQVGAERNGAGTPRCSRRLWLRAAERSGDQ